MLKVLDLKGDDLKILPSAIGQLKNLEYLELSNNEIEILPNELGNLVNLQILYINNDSHFDLQKNIPLLSGLPKLKELHLEGDHFKTLPSEIEYLKSLEYLFLANNEIDELPESIKNLKKLKFIDVSNNRLPHIILDQYRDDFSPTIKIKF